MSILSDVRAYVSRTANGCFLGKGLRAHRRFFSAMIARVPRDEEDRLGILYARLYQWLLVDDGGHDPAYITKRNQADVIYVLSRDASAFVKTLARDHVFYADASLLVLKCHVQRTLIRMLSEEWDNPVPEFETLLFELLSSNKGLNWQIKLEIAHQHVLLADQIALCDTDDRVSRSEFSYLYKVAVEYFRQCPTEQLLKNPEASALIDSWVTAELWSITKIGPSLRVYSIDQELNQFVELLKGLQQQILSCQTPPYDRRLDRVQYAIHSILLILRKGIAKFKVCRTKRAPLCCAPFSEFGSFQCYLESFIDITVWYGMNGADTIEI